MAVETNYNVKVQLDPTSFPTDNKVVIWDPDSGSFALTGSYGSGTPVQNPEDNRILTTNADGSEIWAESYFRWVNTGVSGSSPGKLIIGNTAETGDQIVHIRNEGTTVEFHQILTSYFSGGNTQTFLRTGLETSKKAIIGFGGAADPDLIIGKYDSTTDSTLDSYMTIGNDGNVGIGDTSPSYRLSVTDSVLLPTATITTTNTSNYAPNGLNNPSTINKTLSIQIKVDEGGGVSDYGELLGNPRFIEFQAFDPNIGAFGTYTTRGHIYLTSAGFVGTSFTSDKRLKENIQPFSKGLNELLKIQPKEYDWKSTKVKDKGFIAQELYEIYPEAVYKPEDDNPLKNPWGIDYAKLIPLLVKSIQDQQNIINKLEKRIIQLEKTK